MTILPSCIFHAMHDCRSSIRRIISALKSCLLKCAEAKLRKSSIESVAMRLCNEAVSSMSADRQVLGDVTSPGRVSAQLICLRMQSAACGLVTEPRRKLCSQSVILSVYEQDYCNSNQLISLKLSVIIGATSQKN